MSQPLSAELLDRLFRRFAAVYGAQKVAAMWAEVDRDELLQTWGGALVRYPLPVIGRAVRALTEQPGEWPPTLPHFANLCAQFNRPEHQADALPAPGETFTDVETARKNMARIREMIRGAVKVVA